MNQIFQGKPATEYGDGEREHSFTYASEVVPIIAQAPVVEGASNQAFEVTHLPARNEVALTSRDHEQCRRAFGAPEGVSLDTGLRPMAEWERSVGARRSREFANIEIRRGLPPSWSSQG